MTNRRNRCIQWMKDVIEVHMDMEYGTRPTEGEHLEVIEDAEYIISCLEKQIPKKPYKGNTTYCACPSCGGTLDADYCQYCGQAIDWSEK